MPKTHRLVVPAMLVASLALASSVAHAGGFSVARFGGEHGSPTTDNPTALYYNPAGIAQSHGLQIFLDGTFALRGASFDHAAPDGAAAPYDVPEPAGAEGANNGSASLLNFAAAPMAGITYRIGPVAFGGAFYVPFGGSAIWDKNDHFKNNAAYPGIGDGVQRWYAIDGTIRSMYATLGVAFDIEERVFLGATGNIVISEVDSLRARNGDGSNNIEEEGRALLKAKGLSGSLGVGITVAAVPEELFFGLSYQSRPGIKGGTTLAGTLQTNLNGGQAVEDIDIHQDLPDIMRLGMSWKPFDTFEFRFSGDWQRWSAFETQCVGGRGTACLIDENNVVPNVDENGDENRVVQNLPREWNDTFGLRLGASYWFDPDRDIELFGGIGYDSNAVPDKTLDPALMDFHDVSLSLGGTFKLVKQLALGVSYTHFFYVPRNTAGTAGQATDYVTPSGNSTPSTGPDAGGAYSQWIGALDVNLQASFDDL